MCSEMLLTRQAARWRSVDIDIVINHDDFLKRHFYGKAKNSAVLDLYFSLWLNRHNTGSQ